MSFPDQFFQEWLNEGQVEINLSSSKPSDPFTEFGIFRDKCGFKDQPKGIQTNCTKNSFNQEYLLQKL